MADIFAVSTLEARN